MEKRKIFYINFKDFNKNEEYIETENFDKKCRIYFEKKIVERFKGRFEFSIESGEPYCYKYNFDNLNDKELIKKFARELIEDLEEIQLKIVNNLNLDLKEQEIKIDKKEEEITKGLNESMVFN